MRALVSSRPRLVALVSAIAVVALVAVLWALVAGDGSGSGAGSGSGSGGGASGGSARSSGAAGSSGTLGSTPAPSPSLPPGVVGPGCADYAAAVPSGPGSVAAMSGEPLLTAVAGSPLLTTFASALTGGLNRKVDLAAELRRGPVTVFAPVDSAFALVSADRMGTLRTSAPALRRLLRGHVVEGVLAADQLPGAHRTAAGTTVRVTGAGGDLEVGGAPVICGGLRTSDGELYLVGSVLSVG